MHCWVISVELWHVYIVPPTYLLLVDIDLLQIYIEALRWWLHEYNMMTLLPVSMSAAGPGLNDVQ